MNTLSSPLEYFFPIVTGTVLFGLFVSFIIYFILLYRRTQLNFHIEKEQLKSALLQAQIEIKEETLKTVSQELHDNIGQIASLVKINLNLLNQTASKEQQEKINDSIDLLKTLISDIKHLSAGLNYERLVKKGLLNMILHDVERIRKTGKLNITMNSSGTELHLEQNVTLFLYRMTQEILNNILQHAKADTVQISITEHPQLQFCFEDNGIGFNVSEKLNSGSGLINLKERAKLIGATLTIESIPEIGTKTLISFTSEPKNPSK